MNGIGSRVAEWSRDWRVRVLVPVVLINLAAFGGLYWLMYRYAMTNLVNTHRFSATTLLDDLQLDLHDLEIAHNRERLRARLIQEATDKNLLAINVYDPSGTPIASSRGKPAFTEAAQVQVVMTQPEHPSIWTTETSGRTNLFGVRTVRNDSRCNACHTGAAPTLGAIQIGVDLTPAVTDAKARVKKNFALAGVAWLGLLGLMFWTGGVVIGKPIAQMRKAIDDAGIDSSDIKQHDLGELAGRVHDTLWSLIRTQRQREVDITRHMARAEQLASLGQLAAGLTHEIKNPLAGVSSALELLRDEAAEREASDDGADSHREVYDQILSELRRVTTTVEGLLRLARPQPPQRNEVDLSRVAREVTSLFAARLRRQGITFSLEIPDGVPSLQLDSGLMVQLLMNFLSNAMQATDRGGTIDVLVAPFPRRDGVVLAVSDTGRGIAPENLDRIFEPFFTTKEEGTGLGMAICRQIVEQHGGTMNVESELGKGTRVVVLLPDMKAAEESENHGAVAAG